MALFRKRVKAKVKRKYCCAVIVAAGSSARMGTDKMFIPILGIPVLARSLMSFEACDLIDEIIVVAKEDAVVDVAQLCKEYGIDKATKVLVGGRTRTESALAGASECNPQTEIIAIHDGARPLVTTEIIAQAINAAKIHLAAAPGIPLKDTVKLVEKDRASSGPPRDKIVAIQTPQVFEADLIKAALTNVVTKKLNVTDDCSAVELLGVKTQIIPGSEENLKITTPIDIELANIILAVKEGVL